MVVEKLIDGGLADVDVGLTRKVVRRDLHRLPPSLRRRRSLSVKSVLTSGNSFVRSDAASYRYGQGPGCKQVGLAMVRLRTRHTCLLLRDKNCRAASLDKHQARRGVRADVAATDADLRYPDRLCKLFRHPDWQMHARAIGLADGKSYFIVTAITPRNNDHFAATGMKSMTDSHLTRLMVGIMKLSRRHQVRS